MPERYRVDEAPGPATPADQLASRYGADLEFQLRRVQYIYATEQLHAAAVEADLRNRAELTAGLEHFVTKPDRPAAAIVAGSSLLALDIAIDRWQSGKAKQLLADHITESFQQLTRLTEFT